MANHCISLRKQTALIIITYQNNIYIVLCISTLEQYLQLIGAVEWLGQSVSILEIVLHLIGIDLGVGQFTQSAHFPHENAEGPNITALVVMGLLQGLQGQPLDGSVLAIAQRIVVTREKIATQSTISELNSKLIINTEDENECKLNYNIIIIISLLVIVPIHLNMILILH